MTAFFRIRKCLEHGQRKERGDHDLNPGFLPLQPLRPAAVLVGLVNRPNGLHILFTQRTDNLEHHPGQICFPGGHIEAEDQNASAAALRETQEEIGLKAAHITILGRLETYITRTGFSITPVVAKIEPPFDLCADPHEVADIFEVPLDFIMDPTNHFCHERKFQDTLRRFYAIPYNGHYIWGATAGMLINLYQTLTDASIDGACAN